MTQIPNVLFATGWSNHQLIMRLKRNDQKCLFLLILTKNFFSQNNYTNYTKPLECLYTGHFRRCSYRCRKGDLV